MPVGTNATVKMLTPDALARTGSRIVLANAYHLSLRPGEEVVRHFGGLHRFMGWNGPILTDSGGFQVHSLAELRRIDDNGVTFQSHIDGSTVILTPERAIEIQHALGADIIMAFDECVSYPVEHYRAREAMERTLAWAVRCRRAHRDDGQALFGIVQGSVFPDLRAECARRLVEMDFLGYALGGFSVGEGSDLMNELIEQTVPHLPADSPRYLMGVGTPADILEGVQRGIDMFDCVMPTRNGRNGMLFTSEGIINIRNKKWQADFTPIDPFGPTFVDSRYTKAYLRHLFIAGEMLGPQIASIHNLGFYLWLVGEARKHIVEGDFLQWKNAMVKKVSKRL